MRSVIFNILYHSGLAHLMFLANKIQRKIPIILFHRISPEYSPCWPPLSPDIFEKTIQLLSKYYVFTSLDDALTAKTKNTCTIVFDDGFYDFKLYAFPILIKYNVPVTLFVPTNNIDHNTTIWTSEVDDILSNTQKSKENNILKLGNEKIILRLNSKKNLFNTASSVKNILMKYNNEIRESIIKKLRNDLYNDKGAYYPMLSWNDIQEMKTNYPDLINIQSHSHTHPFLPSLKSDDIEIESEKSKNTLISKGFNTINKIAYPFAGYNLKTIELVKKHYSYAFAAGNRSANMKKIESEPDYKYQIPRFNISDNSPHEIFLRINGFHKLFSS